MDMGVLKQNSGRGFANSFNKNCGLKDDKESCNSSEHEDTKEEYSTIKRFHEKHYTPHNLILNSVLRYWHFKFNNCLK